MSLLACRVILVRPHYPGNVGATARVMGNMGLEDLVLVDPGVDPLDVDARRMATHAEPILSRARCVNSLSEALSDCHLAVATSARHGGLFRKQTVALPDVILPIVAERLKQGQRCAIVFGPEPTGLSDVEITLCQHLITIPTSDRHSSLNLAQAVAICLYELRRHHAEKPVEAELPVPATLEQLDRAFTHLQQAFEAIHFLYGDKADPLMHAFRHLLGRAQPTHAEVKLLHGLARQILWHVERGSFTMMPPT